MELANKQSVVRRKNTIIIKKNICMYMLLLPALLSVIIFSYVPMIGGIIAFKDYDVLKGFSASPWVGFDNFKRIFEMPGFLSAIKRTVLYSVVNLFGAFPFPIILALLINEVRNTYTKKVIQTISYLPHFISWMSVVGFVYSMFSLNGSFNDIMIKIMGDSYEKQNYLFESEYFLGVIFFSGLWKSMGWSSIIYLAAICGVDQSLYEAASIDGCGRFKKMWYITLPAIRVTAVLVLVLGMGNLVTSNFEQVYGFQNVYIQNDTDVIGTVTYREGIQNGNYSLATAFGLFQGIVSFILVRLANMLSKKISDVSIW